MSSCLVMDRLALFLVMLTLAPIVGAVPTISSHTWTSEMKSPYQPEFEDTSVREIQARRGETIILPCTVRNLGDKVVSWIRTKDLHILTSASTTFSADNRIESLHNFRTHFWGLRIRGVKHSDTGRYECQVNTDPKMSLAINLTIIDFASPNSAYLSYKWTNVAAIKGPDEVYVREGSSVSFSCEISASSLSFTPPATKSAHIYWLHDGRQISFDGFKSISMETDYRDSKSVSRLQVAEVTPQDGGLYTCSQDSNTKPASVRLFVLDEHTEAMQRDAPHSSSPKTTSNIITIYILINLLHLTCVVQQHLESVHT